MGCGSARQLCVQLTAQYQSSIFTAVIIIIIFFHQTKPFFTIYPGTKINFFPVNIFLRACAVRVRALADMSFFLCFFFFIFFCRYLARISSSSAFWSFWLFVNNFMQSSRLECFVQYFYVFSKIYIFFFSFVDTESGCKPHSEITMT